MRMPLGFPPDALESGLEYRAAPGDIFVASYPKSGTTWLQYIVYQLVRQRPIGPGERLSDGFPHLEEVGAEPVLRLPEPRLIKTHLPFALTPFAGTARYLVIARNPFDCAVSFFHHTRGFPRHYAFERGSFTDFFECFIAGEVDFGDYFDHLVSWHSAASGPNVLFLTYERLRTDTRATVRDIAAFLGGSAAATDDAGLAAIIGESSLESMRRNQQRWSSRRPDWATPFVRRGEVGDWPELFTPAMASRLLAKFEDRLGATPLGALWPDIRAAAQQLAAKTD